MQEIDPATSSAADLVVQAARLVRASRERIQDIPATATRVLSLLDQHGPSGVSELARRDRCTQPTMSGAVAALVERGWAVKTPDPDDARASLVAPTSAGRAVLADVRRRNAEAVATAVSAHPTLTENDLETAVQVLHAVLDQSAPTREVGEK